MGLTDYIWDEGNKRNTFIPSLCTIRRRKYLCLILLISIISSCGIKTKLDVNDLSWLPYESGDTLIFISDSGQLDTTYILSKEISYPSYNPIEVHGKYHPQIGQISYYNKNVPYIEQGKEIVSLFKKDPEKPATGSIAYFNDYFFFDTDYFNKLNEPMVVLNKKYKNVYKIESSYRISLKCDKIEYIWWSANFGIIQYETCLVVKWRLKVN